MLEHHSAVAQFLNQILFDPLAQLMGFHTSEHHHAVPDHIVMVLLILVTLVLFSVWARRSFSVENPGKVQHLLEVILDAIQGLMKEVIGADTRRHVPLIGALAIYILIGNVLGLVPGFMSPTSNFNVTLSCAIFAFLYYNYQGVRKHGVFKYLMHFAGPVWLLAWLLFPVEIISHAFRLVSLSMRLFGNIFAEELIINSLNEFIFPFLVSIPVMFLALFASTIQSFIFILLTMVYISGAVEEGHESAEHPPVATTTAAAA